MKGRAHHDDSSKSNNDVLQEHHSIPIERLVLRPDEVAIALGISRSKVYELLGSGELPCLRIGKSIRVSTLALRVWINQRETQAGDVPLSLEDVLPSRRH